MLKLYLCSWIARDQEKVMESVRYLIRIRDQNKAKREQNEKEEREKLGLPPKVRSLKYAKLVVSILIDKQISTCLEVNVKLKC